MFSEYTARFSRLLAQDDASEWINILFMVVLAVLWLVGGLVKAAGANRRNQQHQRKQAERSSQRPASGRRRENWLERVAKKAEEIQKAIEQQTGVSEQRARKARPRGEQAGRGKPAAPGTGRIAVRDDGKGGSVLVYERQAAERPRRQMREPRRRQPKRPIPTPQPTRPMKPPSPVGALDMSSQSDALIPTTFKALPHISQTMPDKPAVASPMEPPVIDYSEPESLRRAILHYEILGKPLAFRDPLERTTSF